ncbi:MAG: PEGA domain-containing protein [Candidatus Aminicenantales bacterium]
MPVTSTPPGAKISVGTHEVGPTPLNLSLARNKAYVIRIEMEGYTPVIIAVTRERSAAIVFDMFFIFPVGPALGGMLGALVGPIDTVDHLNGTTITAGVLLGLGLGVLNYAMDSKAGAHQQLTPQRLNVKLEKIGGEVRTKVIFLSADQLRNIRWISVGFSDSPADEILDFQ